MAELLVGPILRRVGEGQATVWVETDAACRVEIAGATADTFQVCGHHYALVIVTGLAAGEERPYEVHLNDRRVWPLPDAPPSVIRIPTSDQRLRIAFGSCLANGPQDPPYTIHRRDSEEGLGPDALRALGLRIRNDPSTRPDALLLLGDQAYADSAAPELRDWIRQRRSVEEPPREGVADFDEYAELYRLTWSDPAARWLLSTVPTAMMFDDHEIIDDWNISDSWVADIRQQSWWATRITSGLAAYWIYEHLGNLSPDELAGNDVLQRIRAREDGGPLLLEAANNWDRGTTGTTGARWSYRWDIGGVTALIVDSRNGRVLQPGRRSMLDDAEFAWLEEQAEGATGHLLIGSSVPWLLARGLHDLEGWNEAVADGAWGTRAARWAESLRRGADLEHWAAFRSSWRRLAALIERRIRSRGPTAATSVLVLSGDVHYSYAAQMRFAGPPHRPVWQLVSSPLRYPTARTLERAFQMATTRISSVIGRALARLALLQTTDAVWSTACGPYQDNGVAELLIDGPHVRVIFSGARGHTDPQLEMAGELQLV